MISISKKELKKSGLDLNSFCVLQALKFKDTDIMQYLDSIGIFRPVLKILESKAYVKITGANPYTDCEFRSKALSLFTSDEVRSWYEEWRNIFPEGKNTSNYAYRGDKQEVLKKLTKFVKEHPHYSKDDIILATKSYVRVMRGKGYAFMPQAHYFIHKVGAGSQLATELESIKDAITNRKTRDPLPGEQLI